MNYRRRVDNIIDCNHIQAGFKRSSEKASSNSTDPVNSYSRHDCSSFLPAASLIARYTVSSVIMSANQWEAKYFMNEIRVSLMNLAYLRAILQQLPA
jgi:hypothetical protein